MGWATAGERPSSARLTDARTLHARRRQKLLPPVHVIHGVFITRIYSTHGIRSLALLTAISMSSQGSLPSWWGDPLGQTPGVSVRAMAPAPTGEPGKQRGDEIILNQGSRSSLPQPSFLSHLWPIDAFAGSKGDDQGAPAEGLEPTVHLFANSADAAPRSPAKSPARGAAKSPARSPAKSPARTGESPVLRSPGLAARN